MADRRLDEGVAVLRLRFEAIIALLRSRDEGLPEISPRSGPSRGFSHRVEVVVDCPDCLDRQSDGLSTFGCETCGGSRVVRSFRERDPYAVGDDEKVMSYGITVDKWEAEDRRKADLASLESQLEPPFKSPGDEIAHANAHPFPWEIERARLYRKWDFAALDLALAELRVADEQACRVLHGVYVYGYAAHSSRLAAVVLRGLVFVEARMPDPIRAPGFYTPKPRALERRDRKMAS